MQERRAQYDTWEVVRREWVRRRRQRAINTRNSLGLLTCYAAGIFGLIKRREMLVGI